LSNSFIHIVSFTIPDPPDYGGAIDVFYKIQALSKAGFKIILHCFQYSDRQPTDRLEKMCFSVHYYERAMHWRKAIGTTPYIMASRYNEALLARLKMDDYPILFEGMHTAILAEHPALANRNMAIRMHNIEWEYYRHLAKQTSNWAKKLFFSVESLRLKYAAGYLKKVHTIFTISRVEHQKLSVAYSNCTYLPVFHGNQKVMIPEGLGKYILYHGNLSVAENSAVVQYIINNFSSLNNFNLPIIIAGKGSIMDIECFQKKKWSNITFVLNPTPSEMKELIENAQIHLLFTFQNTGIKLKLINALFNGRHIVANDNMVEGTGLQSLCHVVDLQQDITNVLQDLFQSTMNTEAIQHRIELMERDFSIAKGVQILNEWINPAP
jgi:hypothetical protein